MKWNGHHMEIPSTLCSNVYDFAFCPEPCYDRLVDLADPEDWGPGNRILRNYLSFSFSRAVFLTERDVDQTAVQPAAGVRRQPLPIQYRLVHAPLRDHLRPV